MNTYLVYGIIFVILLVLELLYFKIADKFNIIDKPNERSSHSTIVLRGGGIIFLLGAWVWALKGLIVDGLGFMDCYPFFLIALTLVAGVSFVDDIHSLPDSVRLLTQFTAMGLTLYQLYGIEGHFLTDAPWWMLGAFIVLGLIIFVGASNIINFMDGINGITAGYALAVLLPLAILNSDAVFAQEGQTMLPVLSGIEGCNFVDQNFLVCVILSVLVFCIFNFRPKGKAKCFAGDVGSISIAFIMLFAIGALVMKTGDVTWFVFLIVYGIDGVTTICHRILLHENLGQAHRKHTFQLMANELKMSHITVSLIFAGLQLLINLGFVYLCPDTVIAHWAYLIGVFVGFGALNLCFRKKYYHLHEEYLASLKK